MVLTRRRGGATAAGDLVRVIWVAHVPVTLTCVAAMISGVPFGAQIAWLSSSSNGWPLEVTRVAAVTHCAVTHGDGAPETLNAQPATTYGAAIITVGWPPTI